MKIHPLCLDKTNTIKINAKSVGLHKLDFNKLYVLTKTGVKNKSNNGIPDEGFIDKGYVQLLGDDNFVWIFLSNLNSWFKTSPIMKVTKIKTGFKFETQNSYYKLEYAK